MCLQPMCYAGTFTKVVSFLIRGNSFVPASTLNSGVKAMNDCILVREKSSKNEMNPLKNNPEF